MKRQITISIFLISAILFLSSCEDKRLLTQLANVPQYLSLEDLRKGVSAESAKDITQPGKIYFYDTYVFINEYMEGVHIVDISDPSSPQNKAFIPIPGNIDIAIKDGQLYADSYIDLVILDITDPENPIEESRLEDILEYTLPEYDYNYPLAEIEEKKGVVTGFVIEEYTRELDYNPYPWPIYYDYVRNDGKLFSSSFSGGTTSGSVYGIGGSMARFLTYDDYLYMLQSSYNLKVADISDLDTAKVVYDNYVGWGLETMFIYEDYLYLGAQNGLYILKLENPANPVYTSMYRHVTSCDPVVVSGNLAYVTLRSGNTCGGTSDLLEVVDISDKKNPENVASYGMTEPYGLGISGETLFVCEGDHGLKVYDAANPNTITSNLLAEFSEIKATDVIPVNDVLFVIGDGGFYIYDYSDLGNVSELGRIEVGGE